jgi:hypothetical protein
MAHHFSFNKEEVDNHLLVRIQLLASICYRFGYILRTVSTIIYYGSVQVPVLQHLLHTVYVYQVWYCTSSMRTLSTCWLRRCRYRSSCSGQKNDAKCVNERTRVHYCSRKPPREASQNPFFVERVLSFYAEDNSDGRI